MDRSTEAVPKLSPRLTEVAILVAQGYSDKAIAQQLGIRWTTLRTYVKIVGERIGPPGTARLRCRRWLETSVGQVQ